ncbi:hypothetical protein V6N13_005369 [Hibiscus sabdariffa]|uniref:Uncharacterized protein n=1 Tax=Hibiscus sabdariffa TaxID=183260 RepID=A0ABR2EUX8_9ROSI
MVCQAESIRGIQLRHLENRIKARKFRNQKEYTIEMTWTRTTSNMDKGIENGIDLQLYLHFFFLWRTEYADPRESEEWLRKVLESNSLLVPQTSMHSFGGFSFSGIISFLLVPVKLVSDSPQWSSNARNVD